MHQQVSLLSVCPCRQPALSLLLFRQQRGPVILNPLRWSCRLALCPRKLSQLQLCRHPPEVPRTLPCRQLHWLIKWHQGARLQLLRWCINIVVLPVHYCVRVGKFWNNWFECFFTTFVRTASLWVMLSELLQTLSVLSHLYTTCWHQKSMNPKLEVGPGGQLWPNVRHHNPAIGFWRSSATVVSIEPFSHGTGTLRCLQKEMATYRHWSVSLRWDPDDVPRCRISPLTKLNTLCRWRCCFLADQSWFMTRIWEEEDCMSKSLLSSKLHRCQISCLWMQPTADHEPQGLRVYWQMLRWSTITPGGFLRWLKLKFKELRTQRSVQWYN